MNPADDMPWFRLYTEFAADPVVQMLAFEDQRHFVVAMCMKRKGMLDKEYLTPVLRTRVISAFLGLDPVAAAEVHRRLFEVGLIDENWHPLKWDKRQFPSDSSTERVRVHRSKQRNNDETLLKRSSNGTDTDTDTDKEKRREQRATRLPADFSLTQERKIVAEAERLPADRTFQRFCDYWRSMAGAKARKVDWDATWRNWCRSELNRGDKIGNGKKANGSDPFRGAE